MAAKIKSGDLVKVIRGKDRGKEGTVKQVLDNDRLIVEGVQIVKKHVRATQQGQQAGIVSTEAPIHRSNVIDRKSTRLNSSHSAKSRMPSSA